MALQLSFGFTQNLLIPKRMEQNKLSYHEVAQKIKDAGLHSDLVYSMITYLKNINASFNESFRLRARAHYRKLSDEAFETYWNFLKDLNNQL